MTWNETKQEAVDPLAPADNEKISPEDWNAMVADQESRLGSDTTTSDIPEGTDLYYTEARVAANEEVGSNTVHRTSNGSEHGYINQDVKTTATPTFENVTIAGSDIEVELGLNEVHRETISGNPHMVTADEIGLGSANNTSDADKPISTATQSALDLKADDSALTSHENNISNPHSVTKSQVGLGNVPNIDTTNASNISTGTLPSSVIPPVAMTTVQVAIDETAMLALNTEEGDVVVRSDENRSYMHNGGSAGTMADFTELSTPTDSVLSVNSQTGTVILTTTDIAEGTGSYYTEARVDANLSVISNADKYTQTEVDDKLGSYSLTTHQHTESDITDLGSYGLATEVALNTAKVSFPEAPSDGNQYARRNAAWQQVIADGSTGSWGDILGDIGSQTDLQNQFGSYALDGHTHTESEITDFGSYALSTEIAAIVSFPEAPEDGIQYARKDAGWEAVAAGGGTGSWGDISGDIGSQTDLQDQFGSYVLTSDVGSSYYTETFALGSIWNVEHNLDEAIPIVQVYDSIGSMVEPNTIYIVDENNLTVEFGSDITGNIAVIGKAYGTDGSGNSGNGVAATFERTYSGNVSTGRLIPIIIPDELSGKNIKEVRLSLLGLPAGQSLKVDVRKSGTATTDSIFTSDAEIEVSTSETVTNGVYQSGCDITGSTVGAAGTTIDSARVTLAADDILWIYITQVGSTIAGADLVVTISVA